MVSEFHVQETYGVIYSCKTNICKPNQLLLVGNPIFHIVCKHTWPWLGDRLKYSSSPLMNPLASSNSLLSILPDSSRTNTISTRALARASSHSRSAVNSLAFYNIWRKNMEERRGWMEYGTLDQPYACLLLVSQCSSTEVNCGTSHLFY